MSIGDSRRELMRIGPADLDTGHLPSVRVRVVHGLIGTAAG